MKLFIYITILLAHTTAVFSVSPDEENLGIVLKENRFNIQYIDSCMSNLAPAVKTEKTTELQANSKPVEESPYFVLMKAANQADFNGALWYYQGNYSFANTQMQDGRKVIQEMFRLCLEKELVSTRAILEYAAPFIVRTKDKVALNLLRLGFRQLKHAQDMYTRGYNNAPHQHRSKTVLFFEGIESSRLAGRFGILAAIAVKTPDDDKEEFRFVDLDEARKSVEEIKISEYKRIHNILVSYTASGLLETKIVPMSGIDKTPIDIFEKHDDNFRVITKDRKSLLTETSDKLKADDALEKESLPPRPDQIQTK